MSRFERVLFTQCDTAEFFDVLMQSGERALLDYCMQWHYPGEHDTSTERSADRDRAATHYERSGYTLSYCTALDYVSLEYDTEYTERLRTERELRRVRRLFAVCERSLFRIDGTLGYGRLTAALTALANAVHAYSGDSDDMWSLGEYGEAALTDMLPGAYWHFAEWHNGQWSDEYAALSALGMVYKPGMEEGEVDNATFLALETLVNLENASSIAVQS